LVKPIRTFCVLGVVRARLARAAHSGNSAYLWREENAITGSSKEGEEREKPVGIKMCQSWL